MEFSLWQVLLLAVIQGVTEFLPVSSSGHLVVVAAFMASGDSSKLDIVDLNIVLHLGTLLSILVFYWRRVCRLLTEDRRTVGLMLVGTIPAAVIGLPLKKYFEWILNSPLVAGAMLIVTGLLLVWISRRPPGARQHASLTYGEALWIGLCQAAAVLPGLSRSGATISAGLARDLAPRSAATFSFLLALFAIAGAGVVEGAEMLGAAKLSTPPSYLLLGALTAFVVGLASLWALVRVLESGRLSWFAVWCVPLGAFVILWELGLLG